MSDPYWYEKEIEELRTEIERLRAAILMAENRLEAAHVGNDDVCRACVDVARSYLQQALKDK